MVDRSGIVHYFSVLVMDSTMMIAASLGLAVWLVFLWMVIDPPKGRSEERWCLAVHLFTFLIWGALVWPWK